MEYYQDVEISKLSWISRGGTAVNYYIPDNCDELKELLQTLIYKHEEYLVVGLTSNLYFKNTYCIKNLISTKKVNHWVDNGEVICCECGTKTGLFSKNMVDIGVVGFEGLVDLPGTIGGAIYGNSGCYGCLISDYLLAVELVDANGEVKVVKSQDLHFSHRSSGLKRGAIKGTILKAFFKKEYGDSILLKQKALQNHLSRLASQPGPKNNLGSTFCEFGKTTLFGWFVIMVSRCYAFAIRSIHKTAHQVEKKRILIILSLAGGRELFPYLHTLNRFIWIDENADKMFIKYNRMIHRLYKKPRLEIEIKE